MIRIDLSRRIGYLLISTVSPRERMIERKRLDGMVGESGVDMRRSRGRDGKKESEKATYPDIKRL